MKQLFIYLFTCLLFCCCRNESKVTILRLGHGHEASHPVHVSMLEFASELEKISEGKMKVRVYPSAQLGKERELIELLQIGSLDIAKVSSAVMENFSQEFQIFSYPYLFTGHEQFKRFLQSPISDTILGYSEKFMLQGLCFLDAGSRNFYTRDTKVTETNDLNGLKIRVMQSNTALRMAKALGASPTPIPQAELYTSIQQGIVDGAENNPITFYSKKHYEVCKYFIKSEHNFVPDILLMGQVTYNRLTHEQKLWVKESIKKMNHFYNEQWTKKENEIINILKESNIIIVEPHTNEFIQKSESFYESIESTHIRNLVMKIKAL